MDVPIHAQNFKKTYENLFTGVKEKYGLTTNEIIVLLFLERNKDKNTAKDMLGEVLSSKSHISKSIDLLISKKIIKATSDINDKKINRLEIVPEKHYIVDEIVKTNKIMTDRMTEGLTKEDIKHFRYCLDVIEKNILQINKECNN